MVKSQWWGYQIRADFANPFLVGRGIEIGAGASPHRLPPSAECLYFDKCPAEHLTRKFETSIPYTVFPMEAVREKFLAGADFLIAHNVLEHTPSEIRALMEWHSYIRDGGIVVLSVPLKSHTLGDQRRLKTPISHLLDDYVMGRDNDAYESREHSFSFCLNWDQSGWAQNWKGYDRDQFVSHLLHQATAQDMDIHWHALDREEWEFVISAAAIFGNRSVELIAATDPTSDTYKTQGEAIFIYRVSHGWGVKGFDDPTPIIRETRSRYEMAINLLRS